MKKLLLILAATSMLISCKNTKSITQTHTLIQKDTFITSQTVRLRDTIITVQGDTLRVQLPQIKDTVIYLKKGRTNMLLSINGNALKVDAWSDSMQLKLQLMDSLIHTIQKSQSSEYQKDIQPVRFIPKAVKYLAWFGGIILLLLLIAIIVYIAKKAIKPI